MNTGLRIIGRPDELRQALFSRSLAVTTAAPLSQPDQVFAGLPGVQGWRAADLAGTDHAGGSPAGYVLTVSDLLYLLLVPVVLPSTIAPW